MLTYINKYPHITWLLTVRNDGTNSVFTSLRDNTDGAQDTFLSELVRIMEKYPWCDGVDIDLERGGDIPRTQAPPLCSGISGTR
jgi:GH18 family chitinase